MRKLLWPLFLLSFFACGVFGQSTVSVVQEAGTGQATATNPTGTFGSSQAAGDANIVLIEYCGQPGGNGNNPGCGTTAQPGPITSVTDTAGNTYTRNCGPITTISAGSYTNACGGGSPTSDHQVTTVEVWSALSIKSASAGNIVTAHMSATSNVTGWNIWMFQIHPASGKIVFDQSVSKQSGTLSSPVAGPISTGTTATTNYPNEFFLAFCNTSNGTCPGGQNEPPWVEAGLGYTNGSYYDTHSDVAYRIVSTEQTGSESFTAGSGNNVWLGVLVTYGSSSSQAQGPQPPTNLQASVQ
jgi:hypothetical protein